MNLEAARSLGMHTRFSSLVVWGCTVGELVQYFSQRVHVERGGYGLALDAYRKSEAELATGCPLREVPGFVEVDGESLPNSIRAEIDRGVPEFLLGFSVGCAPRVVRYLFCLDVQPPVQDVDLVSSHLHEMLLLAQSKGLPHAMLGEVAGVDAQPDGSFVARAAAFRQKVAGSSGTSVVAVKSVCTAVGYGNSGEDWLAEQGLTELPSEIVALKREIRALLPVTLRSASAELRTYCQGRSHPELTCLSFTVQKPEKEKMRQIEHELSEEEVPLRSLLGDGGFAWSRFPDSEARALRAVLRLGQKGVHVVIKEYPATVDAYREFVLSRYPTASFAPIPPQLIDSISEAALVAKWLKPHRADKKPLRGGRPIIHAARAVAPFLLYHQNAESGTTEWFDTSTCVWNRKGGEFMLGADQLQKILSSTIKTYEMRMVTNGSTGKRKLQPVADRSPLLFADTAFTGPVRAALQSIRDPSMPPLDTLPGNKKTLVCKNGVTVDFDKPYAEQVRASMPTDRNTRFTPWCYESLEDPEIERLSTKLLQYLQRCADTGATPDYKESGVAADFKKYMEDRADNPNVFRDIYFEPLGGQVNTQGTEYMEEAIYEFREDLGAITGCRSGHETFKIMYGPEGNSGKGTRLKLWKSVLGTRDREGPNRGYLAVVNPGLVKDNLDEDKPHEDRAKLQGCRIGYCDDFGTQDKPMSGPTIRGLTGGNDLTAHAKHMPSVTFDADFMIALITNGILAVRPAVTAPDRRRYTLSSYEKVFKPRGEYNALNPNHRMMKTTVKDNAAGYVPELVEWGRHLARGAHIGKAKMTWPRPASMEAALLRWYAGDGAEEDDADTPEALLEKFVAEQLEAASEAKIPSGRPEVVKAFAKYCAPRHLLSDARSQALLRTRLIAPSVRFRLRIGNQQQVQVSIFKFREGSDIEACCRLREA